MGLFGTSGIRRVVDKDLMQLALNIGIAAGNVYGDVVVGCDTRTSSSALKHSFISGLLAGGARGCDTGILPTPTLAFVAGEFKAGAMITASHNPPEYNGLKLLNPDGSAFDSRQRKQMEEMVLGDSFKVDLWQKIECSSIYEGAIERHIERILKDFPDKYKVKVVVDCGCGAASVITPYLLERLGCEVISLNCYPSGHFPRGIEPVEANLGDLMRETKKLGADLGIAHDGDADRMMAVDDTGRLVSGDKLLAVLAQEAGAKEVVTSIDASMSIDEMGFNLRRTRVGDPYVSEELRDGGDFGGEPSGSWVFPEVSLCPDGIYAAAQVVAIASRQRLSHLFDSIPAYPVLRGNISGEGISMSGLEKRLMDMKPLSMSKIDGIKLDFEDSWLLIRASGTESKIRVTAEARNEAQARQLYDSGIKLIEDCRRGS
ncbi:phosphoglucosamine mutase [Chloroflexota bacterium]